MEDVQYQCGCPVLARRTPIISEEHPQQWYSALPIRQIIANTEDLPRQYCRSSLIQGDK